MSTNKNIKQTSFDKELLEEAKSETFDSAFYFDDIIKELSDAGFYSEDDDLQSEESNISDSQSLELDNKESETLQNISETFQEQQKPNQSLNKDILKKIFDIENKVLRTNNNLKAEINSLKELIVKQKKDSDIQTKEIEKKIIISNDDIDNNFEKLTNSFNKRIANDFAKDKALDKLYEQLDNYKNSFVQKAIKPFIHDLILYYDRINNNLLHLENDNIDENVLSTIKMFKDELLEIFSRNGIEPMTKSEIGSRFNPEKSNAIKKIKTDDENNHLTIKDILQEGFIQNNKTLRPEVVAIYTFEQK